MANIKKCEKAMEPIPAAQRLVMVLVGFFFFSFLFFFGRVGYYSYGYSSFLSFSQIGQNSLLKLQEFGKKG